MEIKYFNYNSDKKYKFGCVISLYNRNELVLNTFNNLNNSFLPDDLLFIIVDDGSIEDLSICLNHDYIFLKKKKNYGISHSLVVGWDLINLLDIEYFINLDSDIDVSTNWISMLFSTHTLYDKLNSNFLTTGFNGANHKVLQKEHSYNIKESMGGINLFFHKNMYKSVRKSLTSLEIIPTCIDEVLQNLELYGTNPKLHNIYKGWDWGLMSICKEEKINLISTSPSVVQHLGNYGLTSNSNFTEISLDFKNQCVPKIIHQTWKNEQIPAHLKLMQETVIQHHSDYEYKFWTDADIEIFLKEFYPNTFQFYQNNFPYIIQKIDFVRLLLLYHFGGIYIDLDSVCIKNVDDILNYPCTFVSTKPNDLFSKNKYPIVLNNALIASEKCNSFIREVLINIIDYVHPEDYSDYSSQPIPYTIVLKTSGPLCITDSYQLYNFKSFINIVDNIYYYGVEYDRRLEPHKILDHSKLISTQLVNQNNLHFIHMHESSWYRTDDQYGLPNRNLNYASNNIFNIKEEVKSEILRIKNAKNARNII